MSEMDTTTPTHYGAALEMVAALREEVRHLRERQGAALAEIDRLTAALNEAGAKALDDTDPAPTDEEITARLAAGGKWIVRGGEGAEMLSAKHEFEVRWIAAHGIGCRWHWRDARGRPCARPKVTP